ncbi:hypothetical protein MTQ01_17470 [Streptomyces sp. XM4193]|uniref:uridine kinase family protein n=1 Tax=Streptomyces sp. XM4193 TaxID=2929782 RepID=UPI001FFA66C5|nr:hypothetical protein [Streptomyces sp. XM4193]MCK1797784.1 hypothetical protein [Streptomyces sp. XM4193]
MSTQPFDRDPAAWSVGELASWLAGAPPSCGPVRLLSIDGHAGSGKTTLSAQLSTLLGGAPVLHLDDLSRHQELFDWTERLGDQVIRPLSRGRTARYQVYDWVHRHAIHSAELPPAPAVLIEGVGAGRRALRPHLCAVLWLDLPRETAWERGLRRDGEELADFWSEWTAEERAHFADDPTLPYARYLVRQSEGDFQVLPGPAHPLQSVRTRP